MRDYKLKHMFLLRNKNKRAMIALNRSPEFKSSNPKPSAAELFGT